ncbi:MAG: peptide-methionine (S)-S-oxide reductase MsrA [Rhodospirillales bacterium]|nr:peptide-methionine (S)-S-oxide reductase MsrA [Rhodospirillales bacterium]
MEKATFGAGCFWGIEAAFGKMKGVTSTAVGYAGGESDDPTYEQVCSGTTGHAEVVHLEFDPSTISYEELLAAFWEMHDPTTLNRQGPDFGTQYRSAIFCHTDEQQAQAEKSKTQQQNGGGHHRPIVTEITPIDKFHMGEDYHQKYFEKNNRGW